MMNALINRQTLAQTRWDSGAVSGSGVVVQRFARPGRYNLTVLQRDQPVRQAALLVNREPDEAEEATAAAAPGAEEVAGRMPGSLHVDFAQVRPGIAEDMPSSLSVEAQGYAVFRASRGMEGFAVIAEPADGESELEPFDSRRLGKGSVYAVTLIRPGTYRITNEIDGAKGKVVVAYPTVGKTAYRPPNPVKVACTRNKFMPATIDLQPVQGLIFQIGTPARIIIELVEPDDGPAELRRARAERVPIARWRKLGRRQ